MAVKSCHLHFKLVLMSERNPNIPQPLDVTAAEQLIRDTTRTSSTNYWRYADMFTGQLFTQTWGVPLEIARLAGSDLAVIDTLYEEANTLEELDALTLALQQALDPSIPLTDSPLISATQTIIRAITLAGQARMEQFGPEVSEAWLRLWMQKLTLQNHQQQNLNSIRITHQSGTNPVELLNEFTADQAASDYIEMTAETSAVNVAILGALPHAQGMDAATLTQLITAFDFQEQALAEPKFLSMIARIFRLAQDIKFNATEFPNIYYYTLATAKQIPLADMPNRPLDSTYHQVIRDLLKVRLDLHVGELAEFIDNTPESSAKVQLINFWNAVQAVLPHLSAGEWQAS